MSTSDLTFKKIILRRTLFIAFLFFTQRYTFCQEHFRIINSSSSIGYLQLKPGDAATALRNISVKVEYWTENTSGNSDQNILFTVPSISNAGVSNPSINMTSGIIPGNKFKITHDTINFTVPITIHAMNAFTPEYFNITLDGLTQDEGGICGVSIIKEPTEQINNTPHDLMFLNAVNFDFDGSGHSSYVGHLNIFKPDAFFVRKKWTIGLNLGIMKINFSKLDSLNSSYDYSENVLMHPLDSIKTGTKFWKQYNKLSTVTKNETWSFYFQPTIGISINAKCRFLAHIHTELFVDKWNTSTTVTNYQQDSDYVTSSNLELLKNNLKNINQFSKSTTEIITTNSSLTKLNFLIGVGLTLDVNLWEDASLFIQPTIALDFNYARPTGINNEKFDYNFSETNKRLAHLTRFILKQNLTPNLQAVIGIEVRGRFHQDPTYSAYIGANLGFTTIKKLLN